MTTARTIPWPYETLPPRKVTPELAAMTSTGGRNVNGGEQVAAADAGFWQITLDEIPFASTIQKQAWRAVSGLLRGRKGICDVPIYDTDCAPWPIVNGKPVKSIGAVPHSDDAFFSDGSGYLTTLIVGTVSANAAIGAVAMQLTMDTGSALQPGMHFSVLGEVITAGVPKKHRLFRIKRITSVVGPVYNIVVTTPLREAIVAGKSAEFDRPLCSCRLSTDREMETGVDDYAGRTLASVSFQEALP